MRQPEWLTRIRRAGIRPALPALLLAAFLAAPALAYDEMPEPEEVVTPSVYLSLSGIHPSGTARLAVVGDIMHGWHVNAHVPSDEALIPTEVSLEATPGLRFGDAAYPEGEMVTFAFADEPLRVYEGRFIVFLPVSAEPGAEPGLRKVKGVLSYQSCSDRICLAPADVPFEHAVSIVGKGDAVAPLHPDLFASAPAERSPEGEGSEESGTGVGGTSALVFGAIYIGGLLLNLTPCVFPLIPITVAFFGGQVERSALGTFGLSLLYVLGMSTTYSFLGVAAALTGGLFGAALQNPLVLGFVALVLVVLSLSQFGLYEFRIPGTSGIGSRRGVFGAYLMGLVVGLVAAPCIGPFVVALLATVAREGNPVLGFWKFFVLSLGLGTPYLFLGAFSGRLGVLPRAGVWMEEVKKIFGVVLLVMAAYFLGQALPAPAGGYLMPVALVLAAVWLATLARFPGAPVLSRARWILALGALALSAWWVWPDSSERITFQPYSPEAVAAAAAGGRPVLIDFTADWCVPCKEYEHNVFNNAQVVAASGRFVNLKADLTRSSSEEVKALVKAFNIFGPPTIVFLDPRGRELQQLRIEGYIGPEKFLDRMQQAAGGGGTAAAP